MAHRARVRSDMVKLGKHWQRSFKPLGDKVIRDAIFIAKATAPRGHETRPIKSERLYSQHRGTMRRGGGVKGNFHIENNASYSAAVALGRGPARARPGGKLKFPNRQGQMIYVKTVSGASGNTWMTDALKKSMRLNGLKSRVNTHYYK
ncbi:MAG: hypothetical protein ACTH7X_08895 [Brevibacterium aurantiacum]